MRKKKTERDLPFCDVRVISKCCKVPKKRLHVCRVVGGFLFSLLSEQVVSSTKTSKVSFSYSRTCTFLATGAVFYSVCQVWLSSDPPEFFTFRYCARLRNWPIGNSKNKTSLENQNKLTHFTNSEKHLLPRSPGHMSRLTGWASSQLFSTEKKKVYSSSNRGSMHC